MHAGGQRFDPAKLHHDECEEVRSASFFIYGGGLCYLCRYSYSLSF